MVRHAEVGRRTSQAMIKVDGQKRERSGLAKAVTRCWGCSRDQRPYDAKRAQIG